MLSAHFDDVLRQAGFQPIGQLNYRLNISAWWNPASQRRIQLLLLRVGQLALIRGHKSYVLQSVSAAGETWARDIPLLHDYLEHHFPELRIAFSHFRDVPPHLAGREAGRRLALDAPSVPLMSMEQIAEMQRRLDQLGANRMNSRALTEFLTPDSNLLNHYLREQDSAQQSQAERLKDEIAGQRERHGVLAQLQREYRRKGSAAVYTFSIHSNVQFVADPSSFAAKLRTVVDELVDLHRFQVTQKLGGGRLNIHVTEADEPCLSWVEEWFGGALSPQQLARLGREFESVRASADAHVMVTPDEPITVDGHIRQAEKHLAARVMSTVVQRLDRTPCDRGDYGLNPETLRPATMPLTLGQRIDDAGNVIGPAVVPLAQMVHAYVSGTTGGGKSFLARVLIEEAAKQPGLSVLVLDPRNQSVGILATEDRPPVLANYEQFDMNTKQAPRVEFKYFAPALAFAPPLPKDLAALAQSRSIVSFKGLNDADRCAMAARILDAAFETCNQAESGEPRLLITIEEAHLFTRRKTDESAKDAAARMERALDRIAREGRKFGIVLVLVSQSVRDFGYDLASIRQMTTTKIFLRNSDREIEFAADILADGRAIAQLPTGSALLHNADWGTIRFRVRPPWTKVFELSDSEIRALVTNGSDTRKAFSQEARELLVLIHKYGPSHDQSLNISQLASLAGITSKRRIVELIGELESAGTIRTRRLSERGRPRIIELPR